MKNGVYIEKTEKDIECNCPSAVKCHKCKMLLCSCTEGKIMLVGHYNVLGEGHIVGEVKSCCSCYSRKTVRILGFGATGKIN